MQRLRTFHPPPSTITFLHDPEHLGINGVRNEWQNRLIYLEVDQNIRSQILEEVLLDRISPPVKLEPHNMLAKRPLTERLGILQTSSKDKLKIRNIDDLSASGVNPPPAYRRSSAMMPSTTSSRSSTAWPT